MRLLTLLLTLIALVHEEARAKSFVDLRSDSSRVALALGGGGARGLAHIGVLRWLEENDIPVDLVTGTSMGALVGGLWAAGWSEAQLDSLAQVIPWVDSFIDRPRHNQWIGRARFSNRPSHLKFMLQDGRLLPPGGLVGGHKVELLLADLTLGVHPVKDFRRLPRPFGCVATDLESGEPYYMVSGSLPTALRASMSLPSIFDPALVDDRILVDGGLLENLPVELAWRMGASFVIAVRLTYDLREREELQDLLSIAGQSVDLVGLAREDELERMADIVIHVDTRGTGMLDFDDVASIIERGYKAAEESRKELLALRRSIGRGMPAVVRPSLPDSVRILNLEWDGIASPEEIDRSPLGDAGPERAVPLSGLRDLPNAIVYGGIYRKADYRLGEITLGADGVPEATLLLRGSRLQGGTLGLNMAYSESEQLILGATFDFLEPTGTGSWLRLEAQLEGRSSLGATWVKSRRAYSTWFRVLRGSWEERYFRYVNRDGRTEFDYDRRLLNGEAMVGLNLRKGALLVGGLFREHRILSSDQAGLPYNRLSAIDAGLVSHLWIDTRNRLPLPTKGAELRLRFRQSLDRLSDMPAWRETQLRARAVISQGPLGLEGSLSALHIFDSPFSEVRLTQFGGYPWEPGFTEGELMLHEYWCGSVGLRARFSETGSLRPFVFFGRLEDHAVPGFEEVSAQIDSKRLQGFGLALTLNNRLLGPLSMGYSRAGGRDAVLFFRAGFLLDH